MAALTNTLSSLDVRAVLLCTLILLFLRWLLRQPKNLPPGPWGFPVIGSIPALVRELRRGSGLQVLFQMYAEKYGPVFRLTVLNKTVVVLNDYSSVKEAFQHPQLNDRPEMLFTHLMQSDGKMSRL